MPATSSTLARDVITYNAKIWVAGLAATLFVPLSLAALTVDLLLGTTGNDDALARRVLQMSARFETAIDIHDDLTDVRMTDAA